MRFSAALAVFGLVLLIIQRRSQELVILSLLMVLFSLPALTILFLPAQNFAWRFAFLPHCSPGISWRRAQRSSHAGATAWLGMPLWEWKPSHS